tara:strand:+ start:4741 stop:4962 length:222 start_codon:yes stop_codon:yes gene_type:complete
MTCYVLKEKTKEKTSLKNNLIKTKIQYEQTNLLNIVLLAKDAGSMIEETNREVYIYTTTSQHMVNKRRLVQYV